MKSPEIGSADKLGVEKKEMINVPALEMAGDTRASLKRKDPKKNEDRLYFSKDKGIVAVLDGVGGSDDGGLAAELAKNVIEESSFSGKSVEEAESWVRDTLKSANSEIYAIRERERKNIDTVGILGLFSITNKGEKKLTIGYEGDCMGYRSRRGKLTPLTLGHLSIYDGLSKEEGFKLQSKLGNYTGLTVLSDEDKSLFDKRHLINRSIGSFKEIDPTIETFSVEEGDLYWFFSDGATDNLTEDEIEGILGKFPNIEQAKEELIGNALQRSKSPRNFRRKRDDITAVGVQVGKGQAERLEPSEGELKDKFSLWNMTQALRKDAYYLKVDLAGVGEGEERYIAEVNQFKDEIVLANVEKLKSGGKWNIVTRDEFIKLREGMPRFAT